MGIGDKMNPPKYKFYERDGHFHFWFISNISNTFREHFANEISPYLMEINTSNIVDFETANSNIYKSINVFCNERAKYISELDMWCMSFEHFKSTSDAINEFEFPTVYHAIKADLQNKYGDREGAFLVNRLSKAFRKRGLDNCGNNIRVALKSDALDVMQYYADKDNGCCGFYDDEFEFKDFDTGERKTFMIGFNYGH
jgi:hypothetical protein